MSDTAVKHGHPRGLYVLFGAEAWERFSYYGMRALLVLYLVNHLKFPRVQALEVYGLYTGLVYLTPLVGGFLADKLLGRRKAVLIGGLTMALGHVAMAFEPLLYQALGLLIVGNGFFKPNISTIVGGLYQEGDARRDGAFTIFYMGINLGAFFAPIVCGLLGEKVGWHFGFSAAAIGMIAGLGQFVVGQKHLGVVGLPPRREATLATAAAGPYRSSEVDAGPVALLEKKDYLDVAVWTAGACAFVWGFLFAWRFVGPAWAGLPLAVRALVYAALAAGVLVQFFGKGTGEERIRTLVILVLCAFNIFFWVGFEQAGGTMTLFADAKTNRVFGLGHFAVVSLAVLVAAYNFRRSTRDEPSGRLLWAVLFGLFVLLGVGLLIFGFQKISTGGSFELPASMFQTINPLLIVALAPTFSNMWERLDRGRFRTSTPTKMAIGMIILGLGFVVLFVGQRAGEASADGKAGAGWLAAVYAIHTLGELCLSPIGLSMVTKLAPPRISSLAMGLWLGSSAVANYLAGILEGLLEHWHVPLYGFLVVSSIGPALLLLALTPLLKKGMYGRA